LVLWGERDPFLSGRLLDHLPGYVPRLSTSFRNAGHWLQNELPDDVNSLLIDFPRRNS
jgi:pimeloyl-ACP methyl ester carboxylesterase